MLFKCCLVSFSLLLLFIDTSFARSWQSRKCEPYKPKVPNYDMLYKHKKISERKCMEYLYKLDEREQMRKHKCTNKKDLFVIRGVRTKPSEYPHMGALGWKTTNGSWVFLCGSSLISERFVLTSAHCTKTRKTNLMNPHPEIVRLGVVNIYDSSPISPVDVKIKNMILHPKYKSPEKYYDIALIELETTVNFTKYVHPACLNTKPTVDIENKNFTVTGWGETEKRKTSPNLLSATVDLFDLNWCNLILNRNWRGALDHHLCAGKLDGSVDTCHGDSGGPLQFKLHETKKDGTMHMIVAITTFGWKCAMKDTPGVYTQVSSFIGWIEHHVWQDEKKIVFLNNN